MNLYHYRSIENAILELENGTFHFSTCEELNDPLEGYIKIYWQGDKIAWEGLLKNYICSIFNTISLFILQPDSDILHQNILVYDIHRHDSVPLGKIWEQLREDFISDTEIQKLISLYGNNNLKVYKDELAFLLRIFHTKAIILCIQSQMKHGLIDKSYGQKILETFKHKSIDIPEELMEGKLPSDIERTRLMKIAKNYTQDILEYYYINDLDVPKMNYIDSKQNLEEDDLEKENQIRNWFSIMVDFPDTYTIQLMDFIYPATYITCFSAQNNNSVMWGNYADNHKGVCLIYETDSDNEIEVKDISGCKTSKNGEIIPIYSWVKMPINKIIYGDEICERNFFESFGRLNFLQIQSWLTNNEGTSYCYEVYKDKEKWNKQYWEIFQLKNCRKMKEWSYEDEYRLIIDNAFGDHEKPEERNLPYNSKILKGVIFGIRTSEYDKKRIIDAIKKHNYSNLIFYQAEYDEELQKIDIREKKVWNTKSKQE